MKVEKTIDLGDGHKLEFGKSTWDKDTKSVRNRYPTANGGFSPRSSSEIPIHDVEIITIQSIENNYLNSDTIVNIKDACIRKQNTENRKSILLWIWNRFEAFGLLLLLISFGWQMFEQETTIIIQDTNLYQTHEKLDKIWGVLIDDYSHKYADKVKTHVSTNFEHNVDTWKYWGEMKKEKESVNKQFEFAWQTRMVLYFLGSLMILLSKFLKKNTMPNKL